MEPPGVEDFKNILLIANTTDPVLGQLNSSQGLNVISQGPFQPSW